MRNIVLLLIAIFALAFFLSPVSGSSVYARSVISSSPDGASGVCGGLGFFEQIICIFTDKSSEKSPDSRSDSPPITRPDISESTLRCMFYPQYTECQSSDSIEPTKPQDVTLPDEPLPLRCRVISGQIYECSSSLEVARPLPTRTQRFISPSPVVNSGECVRGGCSGQLCEDAKGERRATTCEWKEEYSCYQQAICERQSNGACGFTETDELQMCLKKTSTSQ